MILHKERVEVIVVAMILTVFTVIADRYGHKANRQAQAEERIAAALERAYPPKPDVTHPSMYRDGTWQAGNGPKHPYHFVDLKPIPEPDPQPCDENVRCGEDEKTAFSFIRRLPR